jgi:hypothetical protein
MSEATEKPKSKLGRPPALQADEETLRTLKSLGQIHCTTKEAAAVLGVSEPTLFAFFKRHKNAQEVFENGKENGKASLRRMQIKAAENGNATMLVWLGKQLLGQKDAPQRIEHGNPGDFDMSEYSDDELRQAASVARTGASGTGEKGTRTPSPDRLH